MLDRSARVGASRLYSRPKKSRLASAVSLLVQAGRLGQDPDPGPDAGFRVRSDIEAVDRGRALSVGSISAVEHPDRRRLAGSVRPEQPEHAAAVDLEVEPADRPQVAERAPKPGRVKGDGSVADGLAGSVWAGAVTRQVCPVRRSDASAGASSARG